jgi:DNA-directed RNA polymerase specialized sigma24 family protein
MGATTYIFEQCAREPRAAQDNLAVFNDWFSRSRGLLHFLACRVLGGPERAEVAIENCRLTASRKLRRFDREGAFRSWLVRVLITEALAILRQDRNALVGRRRVPKPSQESPASGSEIPRYQEKLG